MIKKCPRCQSIFNCQSENIAQCECSQLKLSTQTLIFLSKTEWKCLCNNCLKHFEFRLKEAETQRFPTGNKDFVENIHYNLENGFLVFTELYLMQRGYCCQSGCRNCPYGFKKQSS